ncbi:MAG: hypothetical protein KDA96_08945, partial [Planctomycetaceae bacterium]|nr:hypothetical protein [Planctomycetaceae bacterium]
MMWNRQRNLMTVSLFCLALSLLSGTDAALAQEKAAQENPPPDYPRVNPAPWYEVDPAWPRKP